LVHDFISEVAVRGQNGIEYTHTVLIDRLMCLSPRWDLRVTFL